MRGLARETMEHHRTASAYPAAAEYARPAGCPNRMASLGFFFVLRTVTQWNCFPKLWGAVEGDP